ncbi:MAG: ABC transporter permease [Oscillospiraceae bacterium]
MLFIRSCILQLKTIYKQLLAATSLAVAAVVLVAVAAYSAQNLLTTNLEPLIIVIATEDTEDEIIKSVVEMSSSMQDVSKYASLQYATAQDARTMVGNGTANAAVILPASFYNSIMTGENLSPLILVDPSHPLQTSTVILLIQGVTGMLLATQNANYWAAQAAYAVGATQGQVNYILQQSNLAFIRLALLRQDIYKTESLSFTNELSLSQHYSLSAIVFLLMLISALYATYYSFNTQLRWYQRLRSAGSSGFVLYLAKCIIACLSVAIPLGVLLCGGVFMARSFYLYPTVTLSLILSALLISAFCASLGILFVSLAGRTGGVLLLFLYSIVDLFVSGSLIPSAMLPAFLQAIGRYSPFSLMRQLLSSLFNFTAKPVSYIGLLCVSFLFFLLSYLLLNHKKKRVKL